MALCGSQTCGCAFQSETLNISVVDGVVTLEQAEFTSITELENDVANIQAAMDVLPETYVDEAGDTMTGRLVIDTANHDQIQLHKATAGDWAYLALHDASGTRRGFLGVDPNEDIQLGVDSGKAVILHAYGAERMRVSDVNGTVFIGKTAANIGLGGVEVAPWGSVGITSTVATHTLALNKLAASFGAGQVYVGYNNAGTLIGSVTAATASTVAYNTSSDEDLKENIREVDDDLALYWLRVTQPMLFEFKDFPYRPSGHETHVGYVAQQLAAAWPEAIELGIVSPGHGDVTLRTWDEDGNETTNPEDWEQWEIDYSKFTPFLHAALQAVDRRVTAVEARLDALEAAQE